MKRISLPTKGAERPENLRWDDLGLSAEWLQLVGGIAPFADRPTHIQKVCLGDLKVLQGRRNLIVSAPTNSGKSLIGYLFLFAALKGGKRALLLEPFRALAQEKFEELQERADDIGKFIGRKFAPVITTGDYPLDEDAMMSPPPAQGELVIATPERMEVILRNRDYDPWVGSFGAVCVDEGHLIADARRGGTIDLVLASMLSRKSPARVLLLSATLGNTDRAIEWLDPCDLAESDVRWPTLETEILLAEEGESADEIVAALADKVLSEDGAALIAFTYQKTATTKLASLLAEKTGHTALAYHSNMAIGRKQEVREAYLSGECRLLVSTTALGTGINLPATHLVIRDTSFRPEGKVSPSQLLQMLGRAGRGERRGHAMVVLRSSDEWRPEELRAALVDEPLPELRSGLLAGAERERCDGVSLEGAARVVLSILCRSGKEGMSCGELESFNKSMLAGEEVQPLMQEALAWLKSPSNLLAHQREEDGKFMPTALGAAGARAGLPTKVVAAVGRLLRDLFSIDEDLRILRAFTALDVLLLAELLSERTFLSGRFSEDLVARVDSWAESSREKSTLFQTWIRGAAKTSKAEEIFGSLGVESSSKKSDAARRKAYVKMRSTAVIWSRGHGTRWEDIARRWGIDLDQIAEEEWIRNRSWLVAGFSELFDIRCFYFHLKEECAASDERIKKSKRLLQRMRAECFQVLGRLRYCSPLGPLLSRMKSSGTKGVGRATIQKLENAGLTSPEAIRAMTEEQCRALKLDPRRVASMQSYLRRN